MVSKNCLKESCWKCNGTGKVPFDKVLNMMCSACHGSGKLDWISNILRIDKGWDGISGYSGYSSISGFSGYF